MLYLVATPIGNRDDMTLRAKQILGAVEFVVAEDTRHTGELLAFYGIKKPLLSFRDAPVPVMDRCLGNVLTRLIAGESAAYVTDAGTPGVSDPGWRLVEAVLETGISVSPIPGPSAVTTLLSIANKQIDEFRFVGFLPKKKGFQTELSELIRYLQVSKNRAVIFYESPNRVQATLKAFQQSAISDQKSCAENWKLKTESCLYATIGRELTKKFETIYRGELSDDLIKPLPDRGEYVVLLSLK